MTRVVVFVPGVPQPKGSTRVVPNRRTGRMIVISDNPQAKGWQLKVTAALAAHRRSMSALDGPVQLRVVFHLPRPKKHYRRNGDLRADAPRQHITKPDGDKLLRAVQDAVTDSGLIFDDGRIAIGSYEKVYADEVERVGVDVELILP